MRATVYAAASTSAVISRRPDGEVVRLQAKNADVLRRQSDGTWRFVIDNPSGTD